MEDERGSMKVASKEFYNRWYEDKYDLTLNGDGRTTRLTTIKLPDNKLCLKINYKKDLLKIIIIFLVTNT